jgi:hypothetical protein
LTNDEITTTEAQTTTNMNVDDTTQDTTQTDNNETYPRKDTIEHPEQAEYYQDNELDNTGNTLAKQPTTETLETKNDEQTRKKKPRRDTSNETTNDRKRNKTRTITVKNKNDNRNKKIPQLPIGTLKVGTSNINGLTSTARTEMLNAFLLIHNFDVLLLQEVVHLFSTVFYGYDVHYFIGTSRRGAAIVTRDIIQLTNISKIP